MDVISIFLGGGKKRLPVHVESENIKQKKKNVGKLHCVCVCVCVTGNPDGCLFILMEHTEFPHVVTAPPASY